jgi:hypothetical protein
MRIALALALLLAASAAKADGVYDLTASAGFNAAGELIQIDYSYQLTLQDGYLTATDLSYSVADSANNAWVLDYFFGGEFAVSDGPLQFATSLEACCVGIYIDQELYNDQGPTGAMLPQSWSATPVETPEPATLLLLLAGAILVLCWDSANNEPGQP